MKPRDTDISISLLEHLFVYLPTQALLIYRERPREDFSSRVRWLEWNRKHSGARATFPHLGYLRVKIGRRMALAHRVIWALTYGEWPKDRVDHRDGNGSENFLFNLRPATMPQQMQNKATYKNNRSGYTGVAWHKPTRKWWAYINVSGKRTSLGYFDTPKEAHYAYLAAKQKLHPFQPKPR